MNFFERKTYYYDLPKELIAQHPCQPRDSSRLMIVNRATGEISAENFRSLPDILGSGDSLIFNDTKVIPSRLYGKREGGGAVEIFLSEAKEEGCWEALVRPGRKVKVGSLVTIGEELSCEIKAILPGGTYLVKLITPLEEQMALEKYGNMPLPHYIRRDCEEKSDRIDYQTIFAKNKGAVAAPTASLHFTPSLLARFEEKKIYSTTITLHVGLGTFRPITSDNILLHTMHREKIIISEGAAEVINERKKMSRKQVCVGTTCCRALESVCSMGQIPCGSFETDIFIYPGYQFRFVDTLLTNFHLPESSLLMLVCAFAGYELTMEAYKKAKEEKFRFFSYGDAMLIL